MIISVPVVRLIGGIMSDDENESVEMAECGACRTVIPLNSKECPECKTKFSGVSEEALGECGACNKLVPLDSTRCPECGVVFVADDVIDILRNWVNDTGVDIRKLFDRFDENSDGMIDSGELKRGLLSLNLADLPLSQIDRLVKEIDRDENGLIDLDEFEVILTGDHEHVMAEEEDSEDSADAEIEEEPSHDDDVDDNESDDDESDEPQDDEPATVDEEEHDEGIEAEMDEEDFELEEDNEPESESPLLALATMMDEHDISAQRLFNDLDKDGNGQISLSELIAVIQEKFSDIIDINDVEELMNKMDEDGDGMIDLIEFTESMESVEDEEYEMESESKDFPSPMQRRMMSKSWNDAVWPLIHTAFGIMVVLLLVNALFGPVDGSGGMVEYTPKDSSTIFMGEDNVQITEGMVYACDPIYQEGECANSLTPFSGDSSSMPKGFYLDGIIFLTLAIAGIIGSLIAHLAIVPSWRARARAMKEVHDDKDDAEQNESEEVDSNDDDDDDDESSDDAASEDNEEYEDKEDSEDDDEDAIDIGSHVGLTLDEEEVYGTIIEFDDDEGTVTIKEDGSGDEVTGYQDDMFVE
jgi:Ca2+-binding EF-hand superfamily protein/RNA polymerase subunit RPABC4/transcription elongation factor Spt4